MSVSRRRFRSKTDPRYDGLGVHHAVLLSLLYNHGGPAKLERIADVAGLGQRAAIVALSELALRGLVRKGKGGSYDLTDAGRALVAGKTDEQPPDHLAEPGG